MGQRGIGSTPGYLRPGHPDFEELVIGPQIESPYKIDVMRRRWRDGAREAIAANYREPGRRAWAWWRWECPRRDLVWALGQRSEAEALIALGYADREEREAIAELGIIEEQLENDPEPTEAEILAAKRVEKRNG